MSSGPSHVHILGHKNEAIKTWRQLMGPTKVCKTRFENPETIRGLMGKCQKNCLHLHIFSIDLDGTYQGILPKDRDFIPKFLKFLTGP